MARPKRRHPRSSIIPALMIGGTAIGLIGLASLTVAWSMGFFDGEEPIDRTGQLAFPALSRPVSAFEPITREDLLDAQQQLNIIWMPESVADVASRDIGELIGRVLKHDKSAGMVLTRYDFMPEGTKPGVSAGIPPGKFAVTIPSNDIPGLGQLRNGDRFDLMVALQEQEGDRQTTVGNSEPAAVFGGVKPPSLRVGQLSRRHGVKRLVTGGHLVTLSRGKERSVRGSSGLTVKPSTSRTSTTPVTYAEIAIDEEEIGPLTEAISLNTPMTCIVRSGHPDAEVEQVFNRDGLVPVITTAANIEAYSELTDEALIDQATGQLHYYYFSPERIPEHWLTDPIEVYGRVVSRTLRRGSPITETDLLPPGTKPGISAGVPPGMVAMAVSTSQISGFGDLVQGDRFSIHAKVPEQVSRPIGNSWAKLQGGTLDPSIERMERMLSTGIREVVGEAVYLRELEGMATIAVPDDRVAEVAQLIRDESELFVVARSGEEAPADNISASDSRSPLRLGELGAAQPSSDKPFPQNSESGTHLVSAPVNQVETPSRVEVPVLTRDVEAFEPLTIDDFIDPASGEIRYLYFSVDRIEEDWGTDIKALIDRVTKRRLKSGRVVSSDDLAPEGTIPGPSAGVPPGMQGVLVDSSQIQDLDLLSPGSTFSVVSAQSIPVNSLGGSPRRTLSSADAVTEATKLPGFGIAISQTVASGAMFLRQFDEVERVKRATLTDRTTRTLQNVLSGAQETNVDESQRIESQTITVQRFAIAVPTKQAPRLLSALAENRSLKVSIDGLVDVRNAGQSDVEDSSSQFPRTYVREHFSGNNPPSSDVFISDRTYPLTSQTDETHE
ncbi:MAG: hypothetical protein AAGG48_20240 [Planctomycetota bacterium]